MHVTKHLCLPVFMSQKVEKKTCIETLCRESGFQLASPPRFADSGVFEHCNCRKISMFIVFVPFSMFFL